MLTAIPTVGCDKCSNYGMFFTRFCPDCIETLAAASRDIGFVFVKSTAISEILPRVYSEFRKVFSLPKEIKERYAHPEIHFQRGWTPPFTEEGIFCRHSGEGGTPQPDAKENWFIGPNLPREHHLVQAFPDLYHENIWPEEVPSFRPSAEFLYRILFGIGKEFMRGLEAYLKYPRGFFEDVVKDSPTLLRPIHYPPIEDIDAGKIVWGCRHTDINFVTILPASTRPGLWILRKDGDWIPGIAPEGCVIAQVGDMLEYMTGGHFTSAHHEVRAPDHKAEGRLSAALFIHPRSNYLFEPDRRWADQTKYPAISAADLLLNRLRAIGLVV